MYKNILTVNIIKNKLDQFWQNQKIKFKYREPLTGGRKYDLL